MAALTLISAGSSNVVGCIYAIQAAHNGTLDTNERAAITDLEQSLIKINNEIAVSAASSPGINPFISPNTAAAPVEFVFSGWNETNYSSAHASLQTNSSEIDALMKTCPVHIV